MGGTKDWNSLVEVGFIGQEIGLNKRSLLYKNIVRNNICISTDIIVHVLIQFGIFLYKFVDKGVKIEINCLLGCPLKDLFLF